MTLTTTGRRTTGLAATAVLLLLCAALLAGLARPVGAQAAVAAPASQLDATDLGLETSAGFLGLVTPNTFMPVTVRLEPTRLFSGTVEVAGSDGTTERRQVEVAGGAAKLFTFVVPSGAVRVRVQPDGSDQAVQARPDVTGRTNGVLVGVAVQDTEASLQAPAGVPAVTLPATDQRVQWVPFDISLLNRSHLVAGSLSTLVLTGEDVELLDDDGRRNLEAAVRAGLNLVVSLPAGPVPDAPGWDQPAMAVESGVAGGRPTVVPAPDAWAISAGDLFTTAAAAATVDDDGTADDAEAAATAGRETDAQVVAASRPVGQGRVVVTGLAVDHAADGPAWALLVAERDASPRLNSEVNSQRGWVVQQAVSSGGALDVPALGLLAGFAIVYVLAVGPGNALLLRRLGRNELAWVTIPAITVVFLGGAFATAAGTQPRVGLSGNVLAWTDGVGEQIAVAALRAPTQGEHAVTLPGGDWDVDGTARFNGNRARIERDTGNVEVVLDLQALQVGLVSAQRTVDRPAPLQVDVDVVGGDVEVEVTNVSDLRLENVEVRVAGERRLLDDLAPGATTRATIGIDRLRQLNVYEDVFEEMRRFGMDRRGLPEAPTSLRVLLRSSLTTDRPGRVVVVADAPDATSDVLADDTATQPIGNVVAVAVTIDEAAVLQGDTIAPGWIDRALLVPAFDEAWQPSPHAVEGQLTAHLRFRLPGAAAAAGVDALVPDLERGEGFMEGGFAVPVPDIAPGPIAQGICVEVTDKFPDGSGGVSSSCGDIDPEPPGCPEDAVTCEFGPDSWLFEFEDGRIQEGRITTNLDIAPPPIEPGFRQGNAADFLEVWNVRTQRWELVRDAKDADGRLDLDHLDAFGEVLVRVSGGLFPFDYSARGIAVDLSGVPA